MTTYCSLQYSHHRDGHTVYVYAVPILMCLFCYRCTLQYCCFLPDDPIIKDTVYKILVVAFRYTGILLRFIILCITL